MPRVQCPIDGFDEVYITYPDEWLMGHIDKYNFGWMQAGAEVAPFTKSLFAAAALCDKIEGVDFEKLSTLPLNFRPMFVWLVGEVLSSYHAAAEVDTKN